MDTPDFDDSTFNKNDTQISQDLNPQQIKKHFEEINSRTNRELFDLKDPFLAPVEPLRWVIDMFAAKGMITILGGVAGSGKSILIQYLLQLRQKQDLIEAEPGKAIYLTGLDSSETEIRRRAKSIGKGNGLRTINIPDEIIPFITNDHFFENLKETLVEHAVDVIVFDTLADFHEGNLYDAADANTTMKAFRKLAKTTNTAIVLITHTRKSAEANRKYSINDIADSRIFGTKSDFGFAIMSEYKSDSTNLIEIQCLKARSPQNMPPLRALIEFDEDNKKLIIKPSERCFSREEKRQEKTKRIEEREEDAWALLQEGKSQRQIAEELNVSHTTINNDIKNFQNKMDSK